MARVMEVCLRDLQGLLELMDLLCYLLQVGMIQAHVRVLALSSSSLRGHSLIKDSSSVIWQSRSPSATDRDFFLGRSRSSRASFIPSMYPFEVQTTLFIPSFGLG